MNQKGLSVGWKPAAAVAVTAAFFTPLLIFGGTAFAHGHPAASQYQYRVGICHRTHSRKHPEHTIWVARAAVKAHLRHGDVLGACTNGEQRRGKHHPDLGKSHGQSSGDDQQGTQTGSSHGSNGDHGSNGEGHGGK